MKISLTKRVRQAGATILVVCVLIVAAVVIGYTAYKIIKCISKIPVRKLPPDSAEMGTIKSNAVALLTAELQVEYPGEVVTVESVTMLFVPAFVPFEAAEATMIVQFSTNLVDWETLTILQAGEQFGDTNLYDYAFYRAFDGQGNILKPAVNAGFRLQEAK